MAHGFVPCLVRCGYGAIVVVLFQGFAGGRCVAGGTDRQVERCDNHLSFLLLKEPVNARVVIGALLIACGSIVMLIK